MSNVRAKMRVESVNKNMWGGQTVRLSCQYDDTIPEDQRFFDATPTGHAEFQINNPKAVEALELGRSFYVDFTPLGEKL